MNFWRTMTFALFIFLMPLALRQQPTEHPIANMPKMGDGAYRVYDMKEMFDVTTGAPVYWVTAGKITKKVVLDETRPESLMVIEPNTVGLFIIERENVVIAVPENIEQIDGALLEITAGNALLSHKA
jgi:hypothetical protein